MKRSLLGLSFAVFFVLLTVSCFGQVGSNPFTAKDSGPRSEGFLHSITSGASAFLFNAMAPVQKTLNESLAAITRSLQGSRSLAGLLFVMFVSLVYGMFHAAGPGHGKTIVSSFFLANDAKLRHSVVIGYLIAAVHALAALAVVLILYYVIRGLFSTGIEQADHYIQLVTFGIIAVLGAFMLAGRIRGSAHHHHLHAEDKGGGVTMKGLLAIAVPAGAIPCPGAVAVILFALSLHMLGVSVLSVVFISLGMGITISLTGAIVILAKRGAVRALAGGHEERDTLLRRIVEIGGAGILFLFGLVLFLAQL
jgi:ABC-type nickel/cobalt efflux system permease component RcnA